MNPDPEKDLRTIEGAKNMGREFARMAALNFNRDGFLTQVAMVICTKNPQTGEAVDPTPAILVLGPSGERSVHEHKDGFEALIRNTIKAGAGIAVMMITECWRPPPGKEKEAIEWLKSGKTLEDFPGRTEGAFLSLDHKEMGTRSFTWAADIIRDEGVPARLGNWHESEKLQAEGRFARFFADSS